MNTIEDFITLLRDELGLAVSVHDVGLDLDAVADWDSVHLLSVLTLLERRTGRPVSLADAMEASSLREIYSLAVPA